jgi:hypothetical protein
VPEHNAETCAVATAIGQFYASHVAAAASAAASGQRSLITESHPNAEGFYIAMGAARIGDRLHLPSAPSRSC